MRTSMMDKAVALLAAGLFSTALMAGDQQHATTFESLDKNADQQISKSEAQGDKMLSDSFASADANGDGYLNKTEFKSASSATTPPSASDPTS
ncbi:MAG: EF-hand domain-containing protein [Steroidobacteraceae bacterium]